MSQDPDASASKIMTDLREKGLREMADQFGKLVNTVGYDGRMEALEFGRLVQNFTEQVEEDLSHERE